MQQYHLPLNIRYVGYSEYQLGYIDSFFCMAQSRRLLSCNPVATELKQLEEGIKSLNGACFFFAGMPSVVFYRQRDENVAVGYLQSNRKTIHGKAVPLGCEAVQVTWVKEERIPAPVVLGDPEENRFLCTGQFFALPRKDLTKVTLVS